MSQEAVWSLMAASPGVVHDALVILEKRPEIQKQLHECIKALKDILDSDLCGVYLYGSAVMGGLQKYSDIDLFVVINRATTLEEKRHLTARLLEISGIYMKDSKPPLEMTLVEKIAINPWQYPPCFDFQYGEWLRSAFEKDEIAPQYSEMPDLALIITQVLLKSYTLFGEHPEKILVPVPYDNFINAMLQDLERLIADLKSDTRNVLLTLARIWYTLKTGAIFSKPDAADWAIARLLQTYQVVMNRAKLICIGHQDEYWDDIQILLEPCVQEILQEIDKIKVKRWQLGE